MHVRVPGPEEKRAGPRNPSPERRYPGPSVTKRLEVVVNCPTCQTPLVPGAKFCANCGAPAPQATQVGTYAEPVPESDNPKEPIVVGDMSIKVEGELVPVVDVELGTQQTVYFEHHILMWKQPNVTLGFLGLKNA